MKTDHISFSRRAFLGGTIVAGAALIIPLRLPTVWAQEKEDPRLSHAYIRIDTSGQVTFLLPTSEMGQGIHTGQAQILAEELGADWSRITVGMPNQLSDAYRIPSSARCALWARSASVSGTTRCATRPPRRGKC